MLSLSRALRYSVTQPPAATLVWTRVALTKESKPDQYPQPRSGLTSPVFVIESPPLDPNADFVRLLVTSRRDAPCQAGAPGDLTEVCDFTADAGGLEEYSI